jgi:hypothetical protein
MLPEVSSRAVDWLRSAASTLYISCFSCKICHNGQVSQERLWPQDDFPPALVEALALNSWISDSLPAGRSSGWPISETIVVMLADAEATSSRTRFSPKFGRLQQAFEMSTKSTHSLPGARRRASCCWRPLSFSISVCWWLNSEGPRNGPSVLPLQNGQ